MSFPDIPPQPTEIIETDIEWDVAHEDIDWSEDNLLDLPGGVKSKVLNRNEAEQRVDQIHRYPPGYREPEHSHDTAHAVLILEGRLLIDGHELTAGDYVYGQKMPHGPSEVPEGCTIFATFVGGSITHEWDEGDGEDDQ
jgi:quercetin dioxygenase-like cupin family protein